MNRPVTPSGNALWGGRFEAGPGAIMEEINASIDVDKALATQDIAGSLAHVAMLAETGIVSHEPTRRRSPRGLHQIAGEIAGGTFPFSRALEDIHMNIESRLKEIVGERRRPAPHRPLAQRPGGDGLQALGARRARRAGRGARSTCSAPSWSAPRSMRTP